MREQGKMGNWITTAEAAKILGVTDTRIRQLIYEKRLVARKLSERVWLIDVDSVDEYDRERGER